MSIDNTNLRQDIQSFLESFEFDTQERVPGRKTLDCLKEYLRLLPHVHAAVLELEPDPADDQFQTGFLNNLQWFSATEVTINHFYRTIRDSDYESILAYIVESKAVEISNNLLRLIHSDTASQELEFLARIHEILLEWQKEHDRPESKPLLFVFDSVTLQKVLNEEKTALITLKLNHDMASGTGLSGMRTYYELYRDKTSGDKIVYKRSEIYPIFEEGDDKPAGYIRLIGLDKDEMQWLIYDDRQAVRLGFAGNDQQSPLEQFKHWWNATNPDDPYERNTRIWILYFELVKETTQT